MQQEKLDRGQDTQSMRTQGIASICGSHSARSRILPSRPALITMFSRYMGLLAINWPACTWKSRRVLGKPPEPTLHHLRQIHVAVGKLIRPTESGETENLNDGFMDNGQV